MAAAGLFNSWARPADSFPSESTTTPLAAAGPLVDGWRFPLIPVRLAFARVLANPIGEATVGQWLEVRRERSTMSWSTACG